MKKILIVICASLSFSTNALATISTGVYKIEVSRDSSNLYKVINKDIYIKTRHCYEYVHYEEALLNIESSFGYSIGKIYFENGQSCEVEKVLS